MRRAAVWVPALLALVALGRDAAAQRYEPPRPSRADSMLAVGRLAAAEQALYAAADARPRAPEPRGALARYLASRARFRIAEILFEEAQRFGADPNAVRRAIATMAAYRVSAPEGTVDVIPYTPVSDGLLSFPLRLGNESVTAVFDPRVRGVVLGRLLAPRAELRRGRVAVTIASRRLESLEATVDSLMSPTEIRLGLDVLWSLHPRVDSRALTLTLGDAPRAGALPAGAERVPFMLTFPGMLLVPTVGRPPISLESAEARNLLRGTRWQVDASTATLIVER